MTIDFSPGELIKMAIGIERSGIAFYDIMSKSIDNAATQSAFHYLADMEREHVKTFQAMLEKTGQTVSPTVSSSRGSSATCRAASSHSRLWKALETGN